jgi:tetratricopeptide (TPR) repeat protein
LKKATRRFKDGDVLFREGDAADSAFVLTEGRVEIVKSGRRGPVRLALLDKGDLFGEMGIIDQGLRNATARAVGPVEVDVIDRATFLETVEREPEFALDLIGKLVHRLRLADEAIAHGGAAAMPAAAQAAALRPGGGWLGRLMGRESPLLSDRIEVRVAPLAGESGDKHARALVAALDKRKGIRVRPAKTKIELGGTGERAGALAAAHAQARQWLAEAEADLLLWGEAPPPGLTWHLRLTPQQVQDEDSPGAFNPTNVFTLVHPVSADTGAFLHAVLLAAATPRTEAKALGVRRALLGAVEGASMALKNLPLDLTSRERASLYVCFGNAASLAAHCHGQHPQAGELLQLSAQAYQRALQVLTREDAPQEWALLQRNLGGVLQALAERANDRGILEKAVEALRAALSVLTRAEFPREWAAAQNRLGLALYKLDTTASEADVEMLKRALTAFQAAMQVYTRTEAPHKWAEAMNNFAQAAQVLGEHMHNPEVLEKAAAACRSALEVRRKEQTPLLWAATQNNLGSALFLLGKLSKEESHLEGAAEAFREARDVYRSRGADKMALITEKNLARVIDLAAERRQRRPARKSWHEEEDPSPALPGERSKEGE